jgi:hypothetical protein
LCPVTGLSGLIVDSLATPRPLSHALLQVIDAAQVFEAPDTIGTAVGLRSSEIKHEPTDAYTSSGSDVALEQRAAEITSTTTASESMDCSNGNVITAEPPVCEHQHKLTTTQRELLQIALENLHNTIMQWDLSKYIQQFLVRVFEVWLSATSGTGSLRQGVVCRLIHARLS